MLRQGCLMLAVRRARSKSQRRRREITRKTKTPTGLFPQSKSLSQEAQELVIRPAAQRPRRTRDGLQINKFHKFEQARPLLHTPGLWNAVMCMQATTDNRRQQTGYLSTVMEAWTPRNGKIWRFTLGLTSIACILRGKLLVM